MNAVQIIRDEKGNPVYAVVPWKAYEALNVNREDAALVDIGDAHRDDATYPADVARRLASGEPPLKVIREWRHLTQAQLADHAGVALQYISQIERGTRNAGRKVVLKLADALNVEPEVLFDL